jgi:hypothetical protein
MSKRTLAWLIFAGVAIAAGVSAYLIQEGGWPG